MDNPGWSKSKDCHEVTDGDSVYNYNFTTLDESETISLDAFRDKTLLIVNVATYWGLTHSYPQLNALIDQFGADKFQIVAFPCNQFGKQEPGGTPAEIMNGIKYVRPGNGYVPNFNLTKKIDVNGKDAHPLFKFLRRSCPSTRISFSDKNNLFYAPFHHRDIRWNFEKFLIHPTSGHPVKRYDPRMPPSEIADDIRRFTLDDFAIETENATSTENLDLSKIRNQLDHFLHKTIFSNKTKTVTSGN